MIGIDHPLLVDMGLGHLEPREQNVIQRRIYEVLELRIGIILGQSLTNSQRDEFVRVKDVSDEAAHEYLARTIPDYGMVVRHELEVIVHTITDGVQRGSSRLVRQEST